MPNDRYLKRVCDEQQRQIERWKTYCYKQEKLLKDCQDFLLYCCFGNLDKRADLVKRICRVLNEDIVR